MSWGRTALYTFGSMTSQGALLGLYCVRYPRRLFHTKWRPRHHEWRIGKTKWPPLLGCRGIVICVVLCLALLELKAGAEPVCYETKINNIYIGYIYVYIYIVRCASRNSRESRREEELWRILPFATSQRC